MPKSFLQYLKEEEQQGDTLFGYWFRLRSTWGADGSGNNTNPGALGGIQTWGGDVYDKMINLPQFMLDVYDWNGDGIVGDNDQELVFQIAELAFEIYNETGEFPPPMTPADYQQNWEYYSELYGKDFPNPIGFIERPGNEADRPDTLSVGIDARSIDGLYGILVWLSVQWDVPGMQIVYQQYYPEFYEEVLRLYDYDGDGQIKWTDAGAEKIAFFFIRAYFQEMGYNALDTINTITAENFQEFINNIAMFSDKPLEEYVRGLGLNPEYVAQLLGIVPDYQTGPPSPTEVPAQAEAPDEFTQMPI
jgi:hypothetical protein